MRPARSDAFCFSLRDELQTQRLQQLAALTKQVAELAVTQADVDRAVAERRTTVRRA